MSRRMLRSTLASAVVLSAILACDSGANSGDDMAGDTMQADSSAPATLYDRLGGEAAIRSVVDTMVALAAADEELNFARAGTANEWQATSENVETLKQRLVEFVASATGGPQQYTGQDMVTAHEGMAITNDEFDRLAGHLQTALAAHAVPADLQAELITIVESTRPQIVRE